MLLLGGVQAATSPGLPLFRPAQEVAAFQALAALAHPGDVVLAAYDTGNALPAWAPVRVVIGHAPESQGIQDLRPRVQAFFSESTPEAERLALI